MKIITWTKKFFNFIKREWLFLIFLILIFGNYNYLNAISSPKDLSIKMALFNFFNNIYRFIDFIIDTVKIIFSSLGDKEILKIIIIGYFLNKTLLNIDISDKLKELIGNIKQFSYKDLMIELNEKKDREIEEIQQKEKLGKIEPEEASKQISKTIDESEITAIVLDNKIIANYLNQFINLRVNNIRIPINAIGKKIKIYEIQKLFVYETDVNTISITGINPEYKDIIIEVFTNLLDKNLINV